MSRPRTRNAHLPKYVQERHGSYWYQPPGEKAKRIADGRATDSAYLTDSKAKRTAFRVLYSRFLSLSAQRISAVFSLQLRTAL